MGKTRLALEVLHRLYERDLEGRWLVELAGLHDPELIASTVAAALGVVPPSDQTVLQTLISVIGRRPGGHRRPPPGRHTAGRRGRRW